MIRLSVTCDFEFIIIKTVIKNRKGGVVLPEAMGASARIAVIAVFLLLWGGLNFYLGWRGWHYFGGYIYNYKIIYWTLLIFLAASYFLGRWGNHHQLGVISDGLIWNRFLLDGFFIIWRC
jgi:hypothetical protein